jgi:hypothetical protein
MDSKKLPRRALVDSGIVTRAMGDLPSDADTGVCKSFYEAMLTHNREILIAAPTIAEVMRKDAIRSVPRTQVMMKVVMDSIREQQRPGASGTTGRSGDRIFVGVVGIEPTTCTV